MGLSPPSDFRRRTNTTATGRGKDANKLEESRPRTGSGSFGPGRQPAGASAGAADRAISQPSDQAAAGPVRSGRPDLQNLQASVFRLSSHVLAHLPERLGLPQSRGA